MIENYIKANITNNLMSWIGSQKLENEVLAETKEFALTLVEYSDKKIKSNIDIFETDKEVDNFISRISNQFIIILKASIDIE